MVDMVVEITSTIEQALIFFQNLINAVPGPLIVFLVMLGVVVLVTGLIGSALCLFKEVF